MSTAPSIIMWIPRSNDHGDCAVVAIAMLVGLSYEETLSACLQAHPAVLHAGMTIRQIKCALDLLGFKGRARKKFDIEEDTGLLWVVDNECDSHVTLLWAGRIINPSHFDRTALWLDPDEYLKAGDLTPHVLITVEEDK